MEPPNIKGTRRERSPEKHPKNLARSRFGEGYPDAATVFPVSSTL
ncbi:hypothetical protein [Gloeothece verrucosa]|nr:hypothetical protein [Gloeothece verrucosa]